MTQEEVRKQIIKFGMFVEFVGPKKKKRTKTVCQGCGKVIYSDDPGDLDAVITKRGDAYFWHQACRAKVWNSKIRSIPK